MDRINDIRPMTEDQIRAVAPSVFATTPHHSRSDRFVAIPSWDMVQAMMREGFAVVSARQSIARQDDRRNFTKHMLRFRKMDTGNKYVVGDNILEVVYGNGNDGTSPYWLEAGIFRVRCLNGLIAKTADVDTIRIRHTGKAIDKVIEGTYRVLNSAERLLAAPQDWSQIRLDDEARLALAESARVVRFGDAEGNVNTPIQARQLLIPRRVDDRSNDLWTTFNTIQENSIRGGLSGIRRDENGRARRATTRAVTGIDQDVKLNKALWVLAERMAELKKAA